MRTRQNVDRIETEPAQTAKTKESKYINWQDVISRGGKLPQPKDGNWPKFERAWRQWYKTSVKHEDPDKQAENAYYYEVGKDHVEDLGWGVVEIPHTGSLKITKTKTLPASSSAQFEYEVA